jgi:hypothetical protein
MLGFDVSERTVSRWIRWARRKSPDAAKRWRTFLQNHRDVIAAMDFFTIPTITFGGSIASLSSLMTAAGFCTAMSHETQPSPG